MSNDKLRRNATLAHLTSTRAHRTEFVRRVAANFYAAKVDRSTTVVRIGVQGSGSRPNYRLEPSSNLHLIYNRANHERMTAFDADRVQNNTWSDDEMSFAQVEALLGELRAIKTN